jgi:hypothetical protein
VKSRERASEDFKETRPKE